jgi:hypothetical protein
LERGQRGAVLRPVECSFHLDQVVETHHAHTQRLFREQARPADEIAIASSIVQSPQDVERARGGAGAQLAPKVCAFCGLLQQVARNLQPPSG